MSSQARLVAASELASVHDPQQARHRVADSLEEARRAVAGLASAAAPAGLSPAALAARAARSDALRAAAVALDALEAAAVPEDDHEEELEAVMLKEATVALAARLAAMHGARCVSDADFPRDVLHRVREALHRDVVGQHEAGRAVATSLTARAAAWRTLSADDASPGVVASAWRSVLRPLYLEGPIGCGRGLAARSAAAALGRPFVSHTFGAGSTAEEVLGSPDPAGRAPRPGLIARLLLAAGSPDAVILLRSPELAPEDAQEALAELIASCRAGWLVDPALGCPVPLGRAVLAIACDSTPGVDPPFAVSTAGRAVFRALGPSAKASVFAGSLLPESLAAVGLGPGDVVVDESLAASLASRACHDAGVLGMRACADAVAAEALCRGAEPGAREPVHFDGEDLHSVLSPDDVADDYVGRAMAGGPSAERERAAAARPARRRVPLDQTLALWPGAGVLASVSSLDGGAGDVDLCQATAVPRGLRERRLTVTGAKGAARQSLDVALSVVARMIDGGSDTTAGSSSGEPSPAADAEACGRRQPGPSGLSAERKLSSAKKRAVRQREPIRRTRLETSPAPSKLPLGSHRLDAPPPDPPLLDRLLAQDWHVAFVEPAMRPSDGASGGLCASLALLSAVSGRRLPRRLAVTGSLGLTGEVMQVGSIHEKAAAAVLRGIAVLIMPEGCRSDFDSVDEAVRSQLHPVYVASLADAVLKIWGVADPRNLN